MGCSVYLAVRFPEGELGVEEITVNNIHINDFMVRFAGERTDFLSIDTEGNDSDLVATLDLRRFRPSLIQCEPGKKSDFILLFLANNGYRLLAETESNYIFVSEYALVGVSA